MTWRDWFQVVIIGVVWLAIGCGPFRRGLLVLLRWRRG